MAFLLTFSGGASATYKDAVRVARSTQLALTGIGAHPLTVDGVPLNDQDRVLLRGQTNAAENGIYVYSVSGADYTLTRALDANNSNEVLPNMLVPVSEGTANADKIFQLSSYQTPPAAPEVGPIVLDTTELTFTDVLIGLANKADRDLANLLPTSINQSLLFGDDTSYNIGASGASRPQTLYVKTAINLASLTASEILASDASSNVVSLSTATYPSLTELARVKGVTSGIQDQLDLKVDSVSGTAPIASSGGVTPTISISQSGAAQDGYLSSTDWNTFNNKQAALSFGDLTSSDITVTGGVGAVIGSGTSLSLTKGNLSETTSSVLTISGGTSAVLGSGVTIEVAQSGSAQSGYLSSADWATFNAKQDALPPQSDNEDKVLVSDGSDLSWEYAGLGSGNFGSDNVILARSKPASFTGNSTVLLGANAGNSLTSAHSIVAIGANTLTLATNASNNTAIGPSAGRYVLGVNNIFIGSQAGQGNSDGVSSTAQYNVGIGSLTLSSVTSGIGNMAIGSTALSSLQAAHGNVAIGNEAGRYYSPISGYTGAVLIGNTAGRGNATTPANNTHTNTVAIGTSSLSKLENGGSNVAIGALTLSEVTSAGHNTAIGNSAGRRITGPNNVFIGSDAGSGSATPANNTANAVVVIGRQAGSGITSLGSSVLIGQLTGQSLTNQNNETFVGWRCGRYSVGSNNTYFGAAAGSGNTNGTSSTGTLNTAVGSYAGHFLEGSGNTLFGYNAGSAITTGSNNTIIGYNNGTTTLTSTIIMLAGNAERFRVDSSGNMGIGTSTPAEKLEVDGNVLVPNHAVITQTLRARDGVGSAQHDILLRGGDGLTGNHDGGDVTIQGGLKHGTGADGELIFKVAGAEAAKISASNNLDLSCGLIVNSAHAQAGTADVITVADDDFYVGVDCSGAAKTVNLPTAVAGKKLVIKDESGDASTNNITVSGTIDGAANYVMAVDYEALTLVSDGTNWFII